LERVGVLALLIGAPLHSSASPRHAAASEIGIPQLPTKERLSAFIASLAVDSVVGPRATPHPTT